jgi:hypothetical protein
MTTFWFNPKKTGYSLARMAQGKIDKLHQQIIHLKKQHGLAGIFSKMQR